MEKRSRSVQWGVATLVVAFLTVIVIAVVIANTRTSGVTGMDPMKIQKVRHQCS